MKALIIIAITIITIAPEATFAQEKGAITSATKEVAETKKLQKSEPVQTKKQKMEADFQETIKQLDAVINRTQNAIDLLTKNGKDVSEAQLLLDKSNDALGTAKTLFDTFVTGEPTEEKPVQKSTKAPLSLKEQIKKIQDSLKESRDTLIKSIGTLKESLAPQKEADTTE